MNTAYCALRCRCSIRPIVLTLRLASPTSVIIEGFHPLGYALHTVITATSREINKYTRSMRMRQNIKQNSDMRKTNVHHILHFGECPCLYPTFDIDRDHERSHHKFLAGGDVLASHVALYSRLFDRYSPFPLLRNASIWSKTTVISKALA